MDIKNKKALLIIDMQKGCFTPKTPRYDTDGVVKRINELIVAFRKSDSAVIFIRHDGTGSGEFEKGSAEWEILDELNSDPTDIFIDKYANDVFYNSKLKKLLKKLEVKELFITGMATDFCVESTIQSALTKDFHITVVADGHTTGEREHISAKLIIEHYNWVWQNMIPTKGKVQVQSADKIIKNVKKI